MRQDIITVDGYRHRIIVQTIDQVETPWEEQDEIIIPLKYDASYLGVK